VIDPEDIIGTFNAHTHPDVIRPRQFFIELSQTVRSFGQDLKTVVAGFLHYLKNLRDEPHRHLLMEEIAHGVDKYGPWCFPPQWQLQQAGIQTDYKTVGVAQTAPPQTQEPSRECSPRHGSNKTAVPVPFSFSTPCRA
jgi:hypothetical protein